MRYSIPLILLAGVLVGVARVPQAADRVVEAGALPAATAAPLPSDLERCDRSSAEWQRWFRYDDGYYATVDATRIDVDRPLDAGESRPRLVAAGPTTGHGSALRAHTRPLAVRAAPEAPVTFFAPDFGTFANGERSITLRADADGVASATFTFGRMATRYRVVAHSPEAIGWVVFELDAFATDPRGAAAEEGRSDP